MLFRSADGDTAPIAIDVPVRVTRSGRQKSLIALDRDGSHQLRNDSMITAIARAMKWDRELRAGGNLAALAKRDGVSATYATRVMPLAFLAPDIVKAERAPVAQVVRHGRWRGDVTRVGDVWPRVDRHVVVVTET